MKRFLFAAMLALSLGTVRAAAIDLTTAWPTPGLHAAGTAMPASIPATGIPASMSELPEPEVLAMMLVGLILIGYRARRESSDTFR